MSHFVNNVPIHTVLVLKVKLQKGINDNLKPIYFLDVDFVFIQSVDLGYFVIEKINFTNACLRIYVLISLILLYLYLIEKNDIIVCLLKLGKTKISISQFPFGILMESSYQFDAINLVWATVYVEEFQVVISK